MSIWNYTSKGGLLTGVAIGVGLAAAPALVPSARSATRSLLKAALKGGFTVYEKAHDLGAGMVQGAAVLAAEASSEVYNELPAARKIARSKASKPA